MTLSLEDTATTGRPVPVLGGGAALLISVSEESSSSASRVAVWFAAGGEAVSTAVPLPPDERERATLLTAARRAGADRDAGRVYRTSETGLEALVALYEHLGSEAAAQTAIRQGEETGLLARS